MSYKNIWEEHGVYRKYNDKVTGKEIRQAIEEVEGNVRFELVRYVISDFLEVTEQNVTPRDIEIFAAIDKAASITNPDIKVAIVATDEAIQSMASMYINLAIDIPFNCKIFTDLDEAREWVK